MCTPWIATDNNGCKCNVRLKCGQEKLLDKTQKTMPAVYTATIFLFFYLMQLKCRAANQLAEQFYDWPILWHAWITTWIMYARDYEHRKEHSCELSCERHCAFTCKGKSSLLVNVNWAKWLMKYAKSYRVRCYLDMREIISKKQNSWLGYNFDINWKQAIGRSKPAHAALWGISRRSAVDFKRIHANFAPMCIPFCAIPYQLIWFSVRLGLSQRFISFASL